MKTIGFCFGATSVQYSIVTGNESDFEIVQYGRLVHEGNVAKTLLQCLSAIDLEKIDRIVVTGRKLRSYVRLTNISEPEAVEAALKAGFSSTKPDLIVSLGGESQLVYKIGKQGGISSIHSGNKCASGTGEFFLQQIRRMGLSLEQAIALAQKGNAHKIAGRCSVFCKSDCTHALNKGEPKENVVAGLCAMIADKIGDLIKDIPCERIMVIGGGSLNSAVIENLRRRYSDLIVPQTAAFFEAFGAAVWALSHDCISFRPHEILSCIDTVPQSFSYHEPLSKFEGIVDFKQNNCSKFGAEKEYVLGLDVGSTTTKAVLLCRESKSVAASVYLRTNGDPVTAAKNCYSELLKQIGFEKAKIVSIGITGSGRQIAGLHALSSNIINEIMAHATAAAFFDPTVDTIFEIGGQDAKYTFLTAGVPSDYAMNEACSAGTGSFLEESARESLNIEMEKIGDFAVLGDNPPNFTDQCAAFISSDIKIAGQEGIDKNNILAGLVYSVCMNYLNRVKGQRPIGKRIFMQGGVCYNKAVPLAMAALLKTPIIVPWQPGLMGALGVALEVDKRLLLGLVLPEEIDLETLINRDAVKTGSFECAGGKEHCDKKCEISQIRVNGQVHPFGGICNKYYNLRSRQSQSSVNLDYVGLRHKLLYDEFGVRMKSKAQDSSKRSVGLLRSFLTHSLYPLYSHFFDAMGFEVILSDAIDKQGVSRIESAYCLPAEITHGSFYNLLKKDLDYIFVPQVMQLPVKNVPTFSRLCVFVQGEPYFLKSTFRQEIESSPTVVLSPVLRMDHSYLQAQDIVVDMATKMGVDEDLALNAWTKACARQKQFEEKLREYGTQALAYLAHNPDSFGIVLFGRPYNAFSADANMGIPSKVATRGHIIIPHDMLSADHYPVDNQMFWAMGQKIMKSAQFVRDYKQLFGFYITNFSCGPDSFLVTFFRNVMADKPSLTLELDQHTADAGIDTRIEAALDIMKNRMVSLTSVKSINSNASFCPAFIDQTRTMTIHASDGRALSMTDPMVEVILPSMGRYGTEGLAAVMRGIGINAKALPVSDTVVLQTGRKNTSCKECLPYILTTGSFLEYLKSKTDPDVVSLFFMASGGGPCRLGQYCTAMTELIYNNKIPNAAMLSMTNENGYAGLGSRALLAASQVIMVADVFNDIRSFLTVAAVDKEAALQILETCWRQLVAYFEGRLSLRFSVLLTSISRTLHSIPCKKKMSEIPVISLVGEIYVRSDEFSRQYLVDYFEKRGFMVKIAPVAEYLFYSNYVVNKGLGEKEFSIKDHMKMRVISGVEEWWERRIKTILSRSGCYRFEMIHVEKTMESASHLVNENFRGECPLTIGLALREIMGDSCGVVSIGPFGCMPSRVAEAILKKEMNRAGKLRMPTVFKHAKLLDNVDEFPFFALETDGSPFPQLVEANLEAFCVSANRMFSHMRDYSFSRGSQKADQANAPRNVSASFVK